MKQKPVLHGLPCFLNKSSCRLVTVETNTTLHTRLTTCIYKRNAPYMYTSMLFRCCLLPKTNTLAYISSKASGGVRGHKRQPTVRTRYSHPGASAEWQQRLSNGQPLTLISW